MKMRIMIMALSLMLFGCKSDGGTGEPKKEEPKEVPKPLAVGYSVGITSITSDKMNKAKAAGIEYIEVAGTNTFFDENRNFTKTSAQADDMMKKAKKAADDAGIKVWSVHMA